MFTGPTCPARPAGPMPHAPPPDLTRRAGAREDDAVSQLIDTTFAGQFDRLPPHSLEAETCVLASMMLDKEVAGAIVQLVDRESFYLADHQIIFDVMRRLYDNNRPMDAVIVREELAKRHLLDEVGGTDYLMQVLGSVPSAAHGAHYAGIVREKGLLRQLISASDDILRDAYAPQEDAEVVLDRAEKKIFDIAQKKVGGQMSALGDVAMEVYEMLEDKGRRGIETDFHDLDDMLNGLQSGELIIVAARPSMGKAQPLDARVLTPGGWRHMGDLAVGDELASVDGRPSRVEGVFPQGERQVYRVTFADGRSAECCAEHLWRVHFRGWPAPRVIETAELTRLLGHSRYRNRLWIETFAGDFGTDDGLPIDPWLLGLLLGDGCFGSSLRFSTAEPQVVEQVLATANAGGSAALAVNPAGGYDYRIVQADGWHRPGVQGATSNPLTAALRDLGLWDARAESKFVPPAYLNASRESRTRLLAGLLDSDGWAERWGSIRFATTSERLARDVVDLARSLGGTASYAPKQSHYTHDGGRRAGRPSFVCNLQHADAAEWFTLDAKRGRVGPRVRQRRLNVTSVEPTRRAECRCIAVSHPSRLYVTDDYVVTHNTAIAMNMVEHIAARQVPCAVFSLEMSKQQLAQRLMCSRAQIDAQRVRKGMLSSQEYQRLAMMVNELGKFPIWVDDSPGLTILDLRAKARRLKLQHDIQVIMIDYMQLMDNPGPESRQQQISEISRGLKAVARELNVPVICLSQLNRSSETRDGHRPRMSDLRESGSIEQDADVILLLHREDYYRMSDPDFEPDHVAEVIIAKQRNGPTGTVKLTFDNKTTTFKNLASQIDAI